MPYDYAGYGFGNTPFPSRRTVEDRALGFPLGLLSTPPMQRRPAMADPFFGGNAPAQSGNPMEFMVLQQPHSDPFGRQLPSADPMMQQQVAQQVEALRGQMQQREMMRYGMPGQQDPRVGAMMQELESRLGGGPQWRDTTGLGGRMSRLPMPQEQQAPQGPQQDPGLLLQALQLAAKNSGQLSPNNVMRGPGGTYHGDVIDSSGPMQGEDWYPEYIAAAQGGADLPMIRGNAQPFSEEAKAGMAERRQERLRDTLPMAERSANVRSNAIAKSAARHGRMGIPDRAPQLDLLNRLQAMEGSDDPMSGVNYLRNQAMGGPQFAGAAFGAAQEGAKLTAQAAMEQAKLMLAQAAMIFNNPLATPEDKARAAEINRVYGGMPGGPASGTAVSSGEAAQRTRPGGPLASPTGDTGLASLWAQQPQWSGEQFIRAAQGQGYHPSDAIQFLRARGLDNPRAPGLMGALSDNLYGQPDGESPPLQSFLMDLLEKIHGRLEPARLPARFNQAP